MIIDCETHVFETIVMPDGAEFHGCQVERLLADMQRCGVERAILHSYNTRRLSSPGSQFPDPRQQNFGPDPLGYFYESWRQHQERFYWFSVPDPRQPDCIEELEREFSLGLQGIGETQPGYQYLMPNAPECMRVYRWAADKGLPLVITVEGWDQFPGYFPSRDWDAYWDMFEPVIREFSSARWMIGHGGNCGTLTRARSWDEYLAGNLRPYRLAAELENVWVCSCMPWWFRHNQVNTLLNQQLDFLREHVGFERICWGSDWPWIVAPISFDSDYARVVGLYRDYAPCSAEEKQALLGDAAYRFITGQQV